MRSADRTGTMVLAVRRWRRQAEAADVAQPTASTTRWRVSVMPSGERSMGSSWTQRVPITCRAANSPWWRRSPCVGRLVLQLIEELQRRGLGVRRAHLISKRSTVRGRRSVQHGEASARCRVADEAVLWRRSSPGSGSEADPVRGDDRAAGGAPGIVIAGRGGCYRRYAADRYLRQPKPACVSGDTTAS